MTSTLTMNPAESESWAPQQHWSREEWFYMWTKGLEPRRIAVLCRVPYRKVYEHIHAKVSSKPERFGQRLMLHDHPKLPPGGLNKQTPRILWADRAEELVEFRRVYGRFPRGYLEGEQQLYSFLQYQRKRYRASKITESRKSFLDAHVPGWLTPPKKEREDALWEKRARGLEKFVEEHGRYPRYKTAVEPLEKVLAVWMQRQRHCLRIGKLEKSRGERLRKLNSQWHEC
ncbi:helicase associated domain-containing protein [Arthrobacter sunyaminii]|uniref:helicase associated domain-containing protein n=1 Tax=Arthrobacter sunyaminii TaxID=2816859 RepID=UPI001A9515A5|nr:helicase associated domain-containing protein [Arthrobacter sunyaminii]MBO0910114.1 helicase associated domain-containing protein [Arthrobacter sunyaminii]